MSLFSWGCKNFYRDGKAVKIYSGAVHYFRSLPEQWRDILQKLKDIGQAMQMSSLCALGQSAPNPALSTLKKFEAEYIEHIKDKKCSAGKCKKLIQFIITDKCIGCTACARQCPSNCISGERKSQHTIDQTARQAC